MAVRLSRSLLQPQAGPCGRGILKAKPKCPYFCIDGAILDGVFPWADRLPRYKFHSRVQGWRYEGYSLRTAQRVSRIYIEHQAY